MPGYFGPRTNAEIGKFSAAARLLAYQEVLTQQNFPLLTIVPKFLPGDLLKCTVAFVAKSDGGTVNLGCFIDEDNVSVNYESCQDVSHPRSGTSNNGNPDSASNVIGRASQGRNTKITFEVAITPSEISDGQLSIQAIGDRDLNGASSARTGELARVGKNAADFSAGFDKIQIRSDVAAGIASGYAIWELIRGASL